MHSTDIHTGPRQQQWRMGPEVFSQVLSLAGINVECSKSATKFSQKESGFLCLYRISSKCVAGETQVHKKQQCGTGLMSPVFPCLLCSWGIMHFKQCKTMPNNFRAVAFNSQRFFVEKYTYIIFKKQKEKHPSFTDALKAKLNVLP